MLPLAFLLFLAADTSFNGRWGLTVPNEPRSRAWWLEVEGAGTPQLRGKFVGAPGGQLDVIPKIGIERDELSFQFERQGKRHTWKARLQGEQLTGTYSVEGNSAASLNFTGARAAVIKDKDDGSWKPGKAVELFNGRDLSGWRSRLPQRGIGWRAENGMLNNGAAGVPDLITEATFWNFALHVEFRIGKGSNSGVGLRGRYEVQIFDDFGQPPSGHGNGALYSRIVPAVNASRAPGEWQTLDVRIVGRQVTVVLNDKKLIDKRKVEGLTAMATDPNEGRPGPIILQGDHGPVEFRRITLTPLLHPAGPN